MFSHVHLVMILLTVGFVVVCDLSPAPSANNNNKMPLRKLQRQPRNIIRDESKRWPNAEVLYVINGNYSDDHRKVIRRAMHHIESNSCVKFIRAREDENYLTITDENDGCYSSVGFTNDNQIVNLARECINKPTVVHELLHALGFDHQHNSPNRDSHVRVDMTNIEAEKDYNFEKDNNTEYEDFGLPYDYQSIMHYIANEFSKNKRPTIIAKKMLNQKIMGRATRMSKIDIQKLNLMYKCDETMKKSS